MQVDDLREAVLTLAAADKLRAQGFLRSEQNLPKTNKRGGPGCLTDRSCSLQTSHDQMLKYDHMVIQRAVLNPVLFDESAGCLTKAGAVQSDLAYLCAVLH